MLLSPLSPPLLLLPQLFLFLFLLGALAGPGLSLCLPFRLALLFGKTKNPKITPTPSPPLFPGSPSCSTFSILPAGGGGDGGALFWNQVTVPRSNVPCMGVWDELSKKAPRKHRRRSSFLSSSSPCFPPPPFSLSPLALPF